MSDRMASFVLREAGKLSFDFELSKSDEKLEDLLEEIGISVRERTIHGQGIEEMSYLPSNFGYSFAEEIPSVIGVHYSRWTKIPSGMKIEHAMEQLLDDASSLRILTIGFAFDKAGLQLVRGSINLSAHSFKPVCAGFDMRYEPVRDTRNRLMKKYGEAYQKIQDSYIYKSEHALINTPFIDVAEEALKTVEDRGRKNAI